MADFTGNDIVSPGLELVDGYSSGGTAVTYRNRVWNTTSSVWVRWNTATTPDPLGASYPGPGTFGVNTQTPAHVEAVL